MFASSKALAAHRKTAHTAGFDTSHRGRFSALDFARGFSSGGLSRAGDPGALKPSEVGRSEKMIILLILITHVPSTRSC